MTLLDSAYGAIVLVVAQGGFFVCMGNQNSKRKKENADEHKKGKNVIRVLNSHDKKHPTLGR